VTLSKKEQARQVEVEASRRAMRQKLRENLRLRRDALRDYHAESARACKDAAAAESRSKKKPRDTPLAMVAYKELVRADRYLEAAVEGEGATKQLSQKASDALDAKHVSIRHSLALCGARLGADMAAMAASAFEQAEAASLEAPLQAAMQEWEATYDGRVKFSPVLLVRSDARQYERPLEMKERESTTAGRDRWAAEEKREDSFRPSGSMADSVPGGAASSTDSEDDSDDDGSSRHRRRSHSVTILI
jgi:hypothetical protein